MQPARVQAPDQFSCARHGIVDTRASRAGRLIRYERNESRGLRASWRVSRTLVGRPMYGGNGDDNVDDDDSGRRRVVMYQLRTGSVGCGISQCALLFRVICKSLRRVCLHMHFSITRTHACK